MEEILKLKKKKLYLDRNVVLFKASKEFKELVNSKMIHKNDKAYKSIGEVAKILNLVNKKKVHLIPILLDFGKKNLNKLNQNFKW